MKYKKGDKVRFLNEVGEGTITKITNDKDIFVLDSTGFEVPYRESDLILIDSAPTVTITEKTNNTDNQITDVPEFYPETEEIDGNDVPKAYFAIVPENKKDITNSDLEIYLINDCNYIIFYNLLTNKNSEYENIETGILEPNTKIYLFTIEMQEIGKAPNYFIQLMLYKSGKYEPIKPIENTIKIKPIQLFKKQTFTTNDFFEQPALLFEITKVESSSENESTNNTDKKTLKELEKMLKTKKISDNKHINKPPKKKDEKREIDLHINELIDNTKGLSNGEILEIQMNKFHEELKKAIKDNIGRIVFIHGIGNGTLKNTLRKELGKSYPKLAFHDASFKEYGFGATLVVIHN